MSVSAITVSLNDLKDGQSRMQPQYHPTNLVQTGSVSFSTLEAAFGPESLGIIIVKDVPSEFVQLRHRLLSYSSYLGNLPEFRLS